MPTRTQAEAYATRLRLPLMAFALARISHKRSEILANPDSHRVASISQLLIPRADDEVAIARRRLEEDWLRCIAVEVDLPDALGIVKEGEPLPRRYDTDLVKVLVPITS